jgi:hypothetical protein
MTKFIQICASRNDLFALDEEGDVYQYHFNVKTWVKLVGSRESGEGRDMAPMAKRRGGGGGRGDR